MTFLNPAVLFGLAAVAIPIALHLLNLRKLRTVEFSTLAFLKELQKSQMRKLKLRQILLLILRTLVVACVVLAFARPALRGSAVGAIGTHAKTTAVLLLDDSFSMSASDEQGVSFSQAKAVATSLLTLFKEGDEVFLQRFSEGDPGTTTETPTHNLAAVQAAIEERKVSTPFHALSEVLSRTSKVLRGSKNYGKEIYLISDLQRTNFDSDVSWIKTGTSLAAPQKMFDDQTRVFVVPIGNKSSENVSVEGLEIKNRIFEKDRAFSIEARIRNYGERPVRNYTVSLYFDGKRVMQKSVDLPPSGVAIADFSAVPKRTGHISGYIQTEPDAVDQDNQRYFTQFVPEKTDILFVTEKQHDISFLNLALTADERNKSSFGIQTIAPSQLLMTPLPHFDVIIVSNVKSFASAQVERLKQYLEDGGGLILFPGDNVDIAQYNAEFCRFLRIAPLVGKVGSAVDVRSFLTFEKFDFEHPLFSGIFDAKPFVKKNTQRTIESPKINATIDYRPGANGQSIIRLSNGSSFLTEYKIGNGRLLLYSVTATLDWSDFPLKGIFVPLVRRSVLYLASLNELPVEHLAGTRVTVMVPSKLFQSGQNSSLLHRSPDGEEEIVQPLASETKSSERGYEIKRTDVPGVHEMIRGNDLVSAFAVNVDPRESDLQRLTPDQAKSWLVNHGLRSDAVQVIQPNERPETIILQSRFGFELWKYFLGLALLCALAEMIVGRDKDQKNREPKEGVTIKLKETVAQ